MSDIWTEYGNFFRSVAEVASNRAVGLFLPSGKSCRHLVTNKGGDLLGQNIFFWCAAAWESPNVKVCCFTVNPGKSSLRPPEVEVILV